MILNSLREISKARAIEDVWSIYTKVMKTYGFDQLFTVAPCIEAEPIWAIHLSSWFCPITTRLILKHLLIKNGTWIPQCSTGPSTMKAQQAGRWSERWPQMAS